MRRMFLAEGLFSCAILAIALSVGGGTAIAGDKDCGDFSTQAQALAVAIAMPFNFIGNKAWTFSWETFE